MKKMLFVSSYKSPSVLRDQALMEEIFDCQALYFADSRRSLAYIYQTIRQLWRACCKADYCFVRFADFRAFLVVLFAKILHKPSAVAIGGYEVVALPEIDYGGLLSWHSRKQLKFILQQADLIITNSRFSCSEVQKLAPQREVFVIPHGIAEIQKISTKKPIIITIGKATAKIYRLKGLDTFAAVTAELSADAMIIGDFDQPTKDRLLSLNPKLIFPGFLPQSEISKILSSAQVYCQFSRRESFGVALLEAMAAGCIPVVEASTALPEVVGTCGYQMQYDQVESARVAIAKALESTDYAAVQQRVKDNFLLTARAAKFRHLFEEKGWI